MTKRKMSIIHHSMASGNTLVRNVIERITFICLKSASVNVVCGKKVRDNKLDSKKGSFSVVTGKKREDITLVGGE